MKKRASVFVLVENPFSLDKISEMKHGNPNHFPENVSQHSFSNSFYSSPHVVVAYLSTSRVTVCILPFI